MDGMQHPHLFIDETKQKRYIMAAAALPSKSLTTARRELRTQLLESQPRIHFKHESDSRRRQIVELRCRQGWAVRLFTKSSKRESVARNACLEAIVQYASEISSVRIVLEVDDSVIQEDKRVLYAATQRAVLTNGFTYDHIRATSEELLWVPDAIAWCFARGGEWRRRIEPVFDTLITL
jgi:hypothetical protein